VWETLPNGIKRRRLWRFLQICRLMNQAQVDVTDFIKPSKWLAKRGYGKFNLVVSDGLNIRVLPPLLFRLAESQLDSRLAVVYHFSPTAKPYIDLICEKEFP
jgi:hypothetical protein